MNENQSHKEISYDLYFLRKIRWIIFLFAFFILIVISNIPIKKTLDNLVYGSMNFGNCRINIANYEINIFPLPHLNFQNINIPGRCLNKPSNVLLKDLQVYFRGPSFSPFGPHFKIETEFKGNPIEFFLSTNFGFNQIKVLMQENDLDLAKLSYFIPNIKLGGVVKTDALVEMKNNQLTALNLNLQSTSFLLPAQSIMGFGLAEMPIKNLHLIAGSNDGKKLDVKKLVLGDEESPIRCEINGNLKLNPRNMLTSTLDLKGQLAFSDSFLDDPSMFLLKNYMAQFDKRDNFYQIQVKGALSSPLLSSKR